MARDYDDFVDLVDPESDISKIITSKAFQVPPATKKNGEEEEKKGEDE